MTYDQLEALEMIVEKGSFSAAAQALHKTQPTLTVAIQKLEAEFDLQIFDREGYRPELTEAGRIFYNWAKDSLGSFRSLERIGRELGTKKAEARLTVVLDPLASFAALKPLFESCMDEKGSAGTELVFRSEILSQGEELLRAGSADFAIAVLKESKDDIESIFLERVDMIPVRANKLGRLDMDKAWLKEHPHIVVRVGEGPGLPEGGRQCFVSDHALKARMIREGLGWGRLATHEIASELKSKDLIRIPDKLVPSMRLDLHLMRSRAKAMGPVARAVWARMRTQG